MAGCIGTNSCFPLDPCLSNSDCRNGRWKCNQNNLLFGKDRDPDFGQCESPEATGAIFYFTANVVLFGLIVLYIFLKKVIPIILCFRFVPCLRKKKGRGGRGGGGGGGNKPKGGGKPPANGGGGGGAQVAHGREGNSIVGVANARQSRTTSKALQAVPKVELPNLRKIYEASKIASMLISHDVEDGDGVILETINSRALYVERALAVRLYRTCTALCALLDLDDEMLAKVEPEIAGALYEANQTITEGLKASTGPGRGKQCLDRAAFLLEEIIHIVVADCLPWYEGAENWVLEGPEHKALDKHILVCQDIVDRGAAERTCMEICRRQPRKPLPSLPELPVFGSQSKSDNNNTNGGAASRQQALPSVSENEQVVAVAEVVAEKKVNPKDISPATNDRKVRFATSDGTEGGGGDNKKRGLVNLASEICMASARSFDTGLLSTRKFTLANSAMNLDPEIGGGGVSVRALNSDGSAVRESMLARLGRTVSRMQTERAMANILASSPPAALPDLDKLFQHAEMCADLQDGAKIMSINTRSIEVERSEAIRVYRIAALFCKLLHLDPSALQKSVVDKIGPGLAEAQALMTEGMKTATAPDRAVEVLTRATALLTEIIEILTAAEGPFHGFPGASAWPAESLEFLALDEYVHDCMLLFEDEPKRTCLQRLWNRSPVIWRKLWQAFGIPDSMRNHPLFYFVYLLVWFLIVVRFFIVTCDVGREVFDGGVANVSLNNIGTVPAHVCLVSKGRTFLGVGPQYQAILGSGRAADTLIPLLFGVMHSLLFLFGSIPVPMARGFWRDVSYWMPWTRKIIPIDDHIFVHKFLGYMALGCLFVGALIWIVIMGAQECFMGSKHAACTAFDPEAVKNWYNLIENVVMLRVVIIVTWFFGITWMRYQNEPPKYWFFGLCCCKRLPTAFRQHFFEYAYILHVTIALVSFILAEAARFEVFYPVLATWGLYIVDSLREVLFMTFRCDIEVAHSTIHLDPNDNNRPTTMTVKFENPWRPKWRGGCIRRRPSQGAGMWVFVKIPSISAIEWHPFSLASADGDDFIQLQIGIRAGVSMGWRKADNWVLDSSTALSKVTGEGVWVQKEAKTWTYKLYELLLSTPGDAKIPCKIRGPYGSSFRLCFNRNIKGALIMGAGTGLSAVESMLRAMLHRKRRGQYVPNHVWVCWQARRVGDLLWMWDALNELLIKSLNDGTVKKPFGWTPASKTLGFLRITFFISRAEAAQLDTLRHLPKRKDDTQNVHEWLTSRNRIIQSSISSEGTHISKYIRHIRAELNRLEEKRNAKLGISFCGPSAVSKLIADAAAEVGGRIEFSSDATA